MIKPITRKQALSLLRKAVRLSEKAGNVSRNQEYLWKLVVNLSHKRSEK